MDGDGETTWRNLSADNELCGLAVKAGSSVGPLGVWQAGFDLHGNGAESCVAAARSHLRLPGLLLYVHTDASRNPWSSLLFSGFYSDAEVLVKSTAGVRDAHITHTLVSLSASVALQLRMRFPPNSCPTLVHSSFSSSLSSHVRLLQLLLPQSAGPQLLLLSELRSFLVRYSLFFPFRHHFNEGKHFLSHLYFLFATTRLSSFYRLSFAAHDTSTWPPPRALQRRKGHIVPFSPVFTPRVVSTAVARYNFAARDMRELSLREGDMVRIYSKIGGDQGWWKGEANGRVSVSRLLTLSSSAAFVRAVSFKSSSDLIRAAPVTQPNAAN